MSIGTRIRRGAAPGEPPERGAARPAADDRPLPATIPGREDGVTTPGHGQLEPSNRVRVLLLFNLAAASFYVMWWLTPGRMGVPTLFYLLAFAEAFNLLHLLGLWWALWRSRYDPPPPAKTAFSIDVYVATYGEPLEVLRKTVAAAVAMRGEHTTYVLDDGNRPEVRALAAELGAEYIRRETNRGAKAGNLNNAIGLTKGQLIAIFDADHVPRRDFLTRVLGYFEDPGVAFVQTPQFYGNGRENEIARGAFMQQAIFYGPICRGKHGLEAAFCCGTNVVFRREALLDVGGFDEKSVVEDFVTSMRLHRHGWRSVYYPFVLAEGEGPSTVGGFFKQQFRWARGSIGALFSGEPFKRGFTLAQRFQYLLATTFYLIGLVTSIYIVLPIVYLLTGGSAFSLESGTFVFFYAPYLALALITIRWGLGGQLRFEHLRYTFGTFPVYAVAAVASILHLPARFRVTAKGGSGDGVRPPLLAAVPVIATGATIIAIVIGLMIHPIDARSVTNMSWGIINVMLMFGVVRATTREFLRRPTRADVVAPAPPPTVIEIVREDAVPRAEPAAEEESAPWWEDVPEPAASDEVEEAAWWEEEAEERAGVATASAVPWWEEVLDEDVEPSLPETAFRKTPPSRPAATPGEHDRGQRAPAPSFGVVALGAARAAIQGALGARDRSRRDRWWTDETPEVAPEAGARSLTDTLREAADSAVREARGYVAAARGGPVVERAAIEATNDPTPAGGGPRHDVAGDGPGEPDRQPGDGPEERRRRSSSSSLALRRPRRVAARATVSAPLVRPTLPEWALPTPPATETPPEARRRLRPAVFVTLLTLVGLALRTAFLGVQSIRLDEALSLSQAQLPLSEIWRYLLSANVHVPLYHSIMHFWVQTFGGGEIALRIPSLVLGTAAIPLMYSVGKRLIGRPAAVYAAALGATSPFWAWHSNEARMYPLVLFMTLASMALLFNALERGKAWRWMLYAVVTGVSFYAHYFALLMPPVHLAYVLLNRVGKKKAFAWLVAIGIAGAAFIPWVWELYQQRLQYSGVASLTSGVRPPAINLTVFGVVYSVMIFFTVFLTGYQGPAALAAISGVVAGTWPLVAVGVMASKRGLERLRSRTVAFFVAWLVLTVGVVFVANLYKPGLFFQKYLIAASPAVLLMAGAGLGRAFRYTRTGLFAIVAVLVAVTAVQNYEPSNPVREDFRTAASILQREMSPGDVVVTMPGFNDRPMSYYMRETNVIGALSHKEPPELVINYRVPRLANRAKGNVLWIVTLYEATYDPEGEVLLYLDHEFFRVARYQLGENMEIRGYRISEHWQGFRSAADPG